MPDTSTNVIQLKKIKKQAESFSRGEGKPPTSNTNKKGTTKEPLSAKGSKKQSKKGDLLDKGETQSASQTRTKKSKKNKKSDHDTSLV